MQSEICVESSRDADTYAALAEMPTLHNSQWWPGTRDVRHLLMSNWPARYVEVKGKAFVPRALPFVSGAFKKEVA